jgi:hypothetical protein
MNALDYRLRYAQRDVVAFASRIRVSKHQDAQFVLEQFTNDILT